MAPLYQNEISYCLAADWRVIIIVISTASCDGNAHSEKREDTKNHRRLTADVGATDRSRAVSYRGLSRDRGNR